MKETSIQDLRDLIRKAEVKCLICGFTAHSLVAHLRDAHALTAGQYMKQFPKESNPGAKLSSPIVAELLRRIDRSAKQSEELDDLIKLFQNGGTPVAMFAEARTKLPKVDKSLVHLATPMKLDPHFHFVDEDVKSTLTGLILQKNVYNSGPTGCGKTEVFVQVHAALDRPFIRMNMKGDATVANFIGAMRANPQKGTYFKYGALPIAMRGGYTLILDEVDYTPPQVASVMNPVLEKGHTLYLEDTDEIITAAPGFVVMATANTGGKSDANGNYTGTEILNTAFLDRFPIKMKSDYLAEDVEQKMLAARFPGEKDSDIKTMVRAAKEVREAFKTGQISVTLSTRKLIDYFEMKPTFGPAETMKKVLLNWLEEDDLTLVEQLLARCGIDTGTKGSSKNPTGPKR